jgi:UDP-3-O-[3-hydroxymyristoyl] glucosamine N-acyltransferase
MKKLSGLLNVLNIILSLVIFAPVVAADITGCASPAGDKLSWWPAESSAQDIIGDNVIIGDNTVIRQGVQIGAGAVLGQNVLVRKDKIVAAGAVIPDGTTV